MSGIGSGTNQLWKFLLEDWKYILTLTIVFAVYFYYTSTFNFFEKKGIPYMKPTIFLGNLGPRFLARLSFHEFQIDIYNRFKGKPMAGMFEGRRPTLYIFDPDLIKAITIRDFDHFVDRNTFRMKEPRYLAQNLLNLLGNEWKAVRSILTPTFSSARLRNMLPLIQLCANQMVEYLKQFDKKEVEMKSAMGHLTLEVIGACAFGIKCDALSKENAQFIKVAEKLVYMPKMKRVLIFICLMFIPNAFRLLNLSFLNAESAKELVSILKKAKAERSSSGKRSNDFLQLLLDAADTEKSDSEKTKSNIYLDDDTIDAQSLLFLLAGFETSSTLLSFALHVCATKPELQDKLRAHIKEVTHGREMCYELLSELSYLEGFLLETLRMYPPVSRVDRKCTKKYTIPGTNIQIDIGDVVAVPTAGIHMDPDHYPEPNNFRPERFMGDEKTNRPSHLFLAFGAGPRNCIGLRFAMYSAKLAMVSLLKNYRFSVCTQTQDPIKFNTGAILLKAERGCWMRLDAV